MFVNRELLLIKQIDVDLVCWRFVSPVLGDKNIIFFAFHTNQEFTRQLNQ